MQLTNETDLEAGWTMGFERDGRESILIVVKATYEIPEQNKPPELSEVQVPLVEADEFTGAPGLSAPLYETDYSPKKPYCDVLFNGSAYAPNGKATKRVKVSLCVGDMSKSFIVTGERHWKKGMLMIVPNEPLPFVKQSFSYNNAYGGVDDSNQKRIKTYVTNPAGCGYLPYNRNFDKIPMPCTEEMNKPIRKLGKAYRPMALGPIGRSWAPRHTYAGTYDEKWLSTRAPFWPDDFDYLYFQCAPDDQQIPYPQGGEPVILQNLCPNRAYVRFPLPEKKMPILIIPKKGEPRQQDAMVDTIVIEPDHNRFTLTWRVVHPLRKNMFEVRQMIVDESLHEYAELSAYGGRCGSC